MHPSKHRLRKLGRRVTRSVMAWDRFHILALWALALLPFPGHAAEFSEEAIRDALLQRGGAVPVSLDFNSDGKVDAADLVGVVRFGPVVTFETARTTNTWESTRTVNIEVQLSKPYSGFVRYDVSGSATAGTDYRPVTGNLLVNGTHATIPIALREDLVVEGPETIVVTLKAAVNDPTAYALGFPNTHVVVVEDNDARWEGWLERDGLRMPMAMTLTRSNAQHQAKLDPDAALALPGGAWPASSAVTSNSFTVEIGPLMVAAADTALRAGIARSLYLVATPAANAGDKVDLDRELTGSFRDEWHITAPEAAHWSRTGAGAVQGRFQLFRVGYAVPKSEVTLKTLP